MKPIVIHQTDIYHHHLDADDHWDLACQFALYYLNEINLVGIIADNVPKIRLNHGDPSVFAISQMNCITGSYVPMAIGTKIKPSLVNSSMYNEKANEFAAVKMIERTLRNSNEKVVIQMVGSCKDVAIAITLFPELFKEKCAAIYLNAGVSNCLSKTEYNVSLDPRSFYTVFNAPCPLYWLPSHMNFVDNYIVEKYGTFYKFKQEAILPYLSKSVKNYFTYALGKSNDINWLNYLSKVERSEIFNTICNDYRNMWSTAGILSAAGKVVTKSGDIVATDTVEDNAIFKYEKIKAQCDINGKVDWEFTNENTNKYIFTITDMELYQDCMIKAMKELLVKLP